MTTSTTFDPTRIAALPTHGGIGAQTHLEPAPMGAGDAIGDGSSPSPQQREKWLKKALADEAQKFRQAALRRAFTALDHAATALLTMQPKDYITKGKGKGKGPAPKAKLTQHAQVGDRMDVDGVMHEWTGKAWVPVPRGTTGRSITGCIVDELSP